MPLCSQVHVGIELSISDDAGRPMSNALVKINGTESPRRSDVNGVFYQTVTPGTYQVEVSAPGYDVIQKVLIYPLTFFHAFHIKPAFSRSK